MVMQLPGITLTKEQNEILDTCQPPIPQEDGGKGQLVRVTAAAGSGKTTTLLALALRAIELGHKNITYLTFTKAAAKDGKKRLSEALAKAGMGKGVIIDARTLHSSALRELSNHVSDNNGSSSIQNKVWSDKKLQKWISSTLNEEIETFLQPCYREIARRKNQSAIQKASAEQVARDRVEFYIYKSLCQFCRKATTRTEFDNKTLFGRDYYPAKKFHDSKDSEKLGFFTRVYQRRLHWYADQAALLWDRIVEDDIRTFDFLMKRAQLLGLEISGTILLIDESQDMDGCQIHWVAEQQVKFSKHVFVVGDAAQSIYGFRGAKSEYLMDLSIDREQKLTESWRFGTGICYIANLVLFAKHNSDQTSRRYNGRQKWKNWSPYRVQAGMKHKASKVTDESLLLQWKEYRARSEKITFIARYNKSLFSETLLLIGFTPNTNKDKDDIISANADPTSASGSGSSELRNEDSEEEDYDFVDGDGNNIDNSIENNLPSQQNDGSIGTTPKIHINGYGENSGRKAWNAMFKLIGAIYDLYKISQEDPSSTMKLPPEQFHEFSGKEVSWSSFCEDVREREMNKYAVAIAVVKMHGEDTMSAIDLFKREVIDRNYSVEDADIILTTCHAAKGMEWDNVQIADDFIDLATYECDSGKQESGFSFGFKRRKIAKKWKFAFESWGDEVNLAYVACTRAKHTLSLPSCFLNCIQDFDAIFSWINEADCSDQPPCIKGYLNGEGPADADSLKEIHNSLVRNFRVEVCAPKDCPLVDHLLRPHP